MFYTKVDVKMCPVSLSVCLQFIWKEKTHRTNEQWQWRLQELRKGSIGTKGPKMVSSKQWILNMGNF